MKNLNHARYLAGALACGGIHALSSAAAARSTAT